MDVFVTVEPLEGGELERLITVLLNATGVVRQMIERVDAPPDTDGVEIIDLVAERLHDCLSRSPSTTATTNSRWSPGSSPTRRSSARRRSASVTSTSR